MATEYHLITQNGTAGSYWASLTTEQKARYYYGGAYRVYNGFGAWNTALGSRRSLETDLVVEVQGAWEDTSFGGTSLYGFKSITIHSKIGDIRSNAFHNGVIGSGFRITINATYVTFFSIEQPSVTIDGLEIRNTDTSANDVRSAIYLVGAATRAVIINNILENQRGITLYSNDFYVANNIFYHCTYAGLHLRPDVAANGYVLNNLAIACGTGFRQEAGSTSEARVIGNISIGNTTNWTTGIVGSGRAYHAYNFGLSGEAWDNTGTRQVIATTDFTNFASLDFTPASSTSPQVNIIPNTLDSPNFDIVDKYRPDYEESSYPNNLGDAGIFEYDHGEGNTPPNYQPVEISGIVPGSRVKIKKVSDGSTIYNDIVSGATLSFSYNAGMANTAVTVDIRKGSAAPYYKPLHTIGTISYLSGMSISVTQIEAIAAAAYPTQIATDWSINTSTGAITRNSGGQYTYQALYSWLLDYYDDETTVDLPMPIEGITPAQFELINSGNISDTDFQHLNGGSCWDGTTLWANLTTVGTQESGTMMRVYVDDVEYTDYWSTGNIDVSLKIPSFDGTEHVDVRCREYTDTYDHWHFDGLSEGKNYAAISTADDPNNQTASGTVAAYGITITVDNPTDKQIDTEDTPSDYTTTIDANGLGVLEVYEFCKYSTQYPSVYESANAAWDEIKISPYGTFAGGVFFGARGIWLENVAAGDALNYILTDNYGNTHQAAAPPVQISVTNIASSTVSMLQLYDLTNDVQLYVGAVTGGSFNLEKTWTGDIDVRVRLQGFSGSTAYEFYESVGVFTSAGMTMRVDQSPDNTYNANAINGSTISNVSINDGTLLVNVSTGSISWAELYAYGVYWLSTEAGIIDEGSFVEAVDPANYIWTDFKIKNTTSPSVPLVISGGWGRDSATNTTLGLVDTSGGTIFATPDVILPYAAGAEATVAIVQAGMTAQGYSTTRASKLDTVASDVWSYER